MTRLTVAGVLLTAVPVWGQPTLGLVDLNDGRIELQITTDAPIAVLDAMIAAAWDLGDQQTLQIEAAAPGALFTQAVPGDSPFIPGNEMTPGLAFEPEDKRLFASFRALEVPIGTLPFLTLSYVGAGGLEASGVITTDGVENAVSVFNWPPPPQFLFGDFEPDGDVDIIDFGRFAQCFMFPGDYDPLCDSEPDGDVDIVDFGLFADNFGIGTTAAVPEPSAGLLIALAATAAAAFRSHPTPGASLP